MIPGCSTFTYFLSTQAPNTPRMCLRGVYTAAVRSKQISALSKLSVLLTGALQQEMAWTEMSFSITLTLTGVLRGESAGKTPVTGAPEPRLDPATGR